MENRRQDRVGALIQRELSNVLQRSVKDPRLALCTVTYLEVSADLKYVDVKVSVIGDRQRRTEVLDGLKSAAGFIRREVSRGLALRYSPEFRFSLDESVDHLMKIDDLLKQLESEEEENTSSVSDS